ncbi:MAG: type VI secretion system baseplate subunit TssG [Planctomycetes bacterium]|nr:type VI secretion system baseplate subunit TssG [Planctomycetota bacterium]
MDEAADTTAPLLERLLTRGCAFDFFQAVWLLERYAAEGVAVGGRGPAAQESVRFRPDVSVGFPASDVRSVTQVHERETDRTQFLMDVTFMGLYGVSTPLPLHYAIDILRAVDRDAKVRTESRGGVPSAADGAASGGAVASEDVEGLSPTRDFLDIFHHRLISLFYRSWLKYRYERAYGLAQRDAITDYLLWLIGYPRQYDEATVGVSPHRLLRYAGVLTQRPRSAATLEGFLSDYWLGLQVEVHQCVGRWVTLSAADRNAIGLGKCSLGRDLTVGAEVYDLSGTFRVSVGPVLWDTYLAFLPDGPCYAETRALVERFRVDPLAFGVEVRLAADQVPEMQLTSGDDAARLGYTSWVRTDALPETNVIFAPSIATPRPRAPGPDAAAALAASTGALAR